MKRQTLRLGLSLMIALAFWANHLPAQEVVPHPAGVFVVPTVPYEPALVPASPMQFGAPAAPGLGRHPLQHHLNQHGMSCKSNYPWGCCGNFHYDFHFVFGSCRSFFEERCDPNQGSGKHRYR